MFRRVLVGRLIGLTALSCASVLFSQSKPTTSKPADLLEFPVVMRQNITAGKTPVGARVQAKLTIATLMHGVVVPKDALFTGEVTESTAKSDKAPSRLAIRMDTAEWKNGSTPLKVYLTAWYYPLKSEERDQQDPFSAMHGQVGITFGSAPNPYPPGAQGSMTGDDRNRYPDPTPPAPSVTSTHRILMESVTPAKNNDGSLVITSNKRTIKLDKLATYVFATNDLGSLK
jgi:hypothetical protein